MNEQLKKLAVQAGLYYKTVSGKNYDLAIERFAELVRQDEREAIAKICDEATNLDWFAKEIRARGVK